MKLFSPFSGLHIFYSHREDGSFRDRDSVIRFLNPQPPIEIRFLNLEHSNQIIRVDHQSEMVFSGDTIMTNQLAQLITFVVADCFPVVLFDPVHKACALIHAGWKSLAQDIIALSVEAMHNTFQTEPTDLQVWIGPGICKECYVQEVQPDQYGREGWELAIQKQDDGNFSVDLPRFIRSELEKLHVQDNRIIDEQLCTYMQKPLLFSHRRSTKTGDEDGRFFVIVGLNEED